jgi:hypothetical protein
MIVLEDFRSRGSINPDLLAASEGCAAMLRLLPDVFGVLLLNALSSDLAALTRREFPPPGHYVSPNQLNCSDRIFPELSVIDNYLQHRD